MDSSTVGLAAIIACVLMFTWWLVQWARKPSINAELVDEETDGGALATVPKCKCCEAADATRAFPTFSRAVVIKRGEEFISYARDSTAGRDLSGHVPLHHRELCDSCGHRADTAVDAFILEKVRGMRAKSNDLIEQGVAQYERGGLLQQLKTSTVTEASAPRAEMASVTSLRPGLRAANG